MRLPRLYPIVDRAALDARGLELAEFVRELIKQGAGLLQYRDKGSSPQEILRAATKISETLDGRECLLVMNDRADLAVLAGWPGVHVGQGDLPVEAVRLVLCGDSSKNSWAHSSRQERHEKRGTRVAGDLNRRFVGVSTHTDEQVRMANAGSADYIAVGPVFATGSKADAESVIGLEGVRRARALTSKPLVAIGGITRENARSVIEAGADSVAVIGALLSPSERPGAIAGEFLELLR